MKINAQQAMDTAIEVTEEIDNEYKSIFGRGYGLIEKFHWQNPSTVLLTTGTATSTARHLLREDPAFKDVGLLKLRMFRPFPVDAVRKALKGIKKVAVIDRNLSFGHEGIFLQELKSALYPVTEKPNIFGFVAGLGGADITTDTIREALEFTISNDTSEKSIHWLPQSIEKASLKEASEEAEDIDNTFPKNEYLYWGHSACPGCGEAIAWRHILQAMGKNMFCVIPAGCSSVIAGIWPRSALKIPSVH